MKQNSHKIPFGELVALMSVLSFKNSSDNNLVSHKGQERTRMLVKHTTKSYLMACF